MKTDLNKVSEDFNVEIQVISESWKLLWLNGTELQLWIQTIMNLSEDFYFEKVFF